MQMQLNAFSRGKEGRERVATPGCTYVPRLSCSCAVNTIWPSLSAAKAHKMRINKQFFPGIFASAWIKYKMQFLFVCQPGYKAPYACTLAPQSLILMTPFDGVWLPRPTHCTHPPENPSLPSASAQFPPRLKWSWAEFWYPIYFYIILCINVINKCLCVCPPSVWGPSEWCLR